MDKEKIVDIIADITLYIELQSKKEDRLRIGTLMALLIVLHAMDATPTDEEIKIAHNTIMKIVMDATPTDEEIKIVHNTIMKIVEDK